MKIKKHFIIGVLLTIATIQTTTDCLKKGSTKSTKKISDKIKKTSDGIMSAFKMKGNTFKNWETSSIARNFNKVIGFAPVFKENDVHKLLDLILHEADLIKIGAFKKLIKLSKSASSVEAKKELALAKIQGATELVKYYGVVYNCPKVKYTFGQGLYYAHACVKLHSSNPGECLKRKAQLIVSFFFSHKIEINHGMRYWISKVSAEAGKHLQNDKTLKFIDTRITCEIKLMQEDKNIFLKSLAKLYSGGTKKDKSYDCVTELLQFQNDIEEVGSYTAEYYYLLGKAFAHKGDYASALSSLRKARKGEVVDQKTRFINKRIQTYYEKIYARAESEKNGKK